MSIFNKDIFQGNLNKNQYFEGWYFKNISADLKSVYSIIAGVSLNKNDKHAFIQIINGITNKTHYIRYDISEFYYDKKIFFITIGNNQFSKDYIFIDIDTDDIKMKGGIDYLHSVSYPKSIRSPGIMGYFSYIPKMECNHGIVSVTNQTKGELIVNNEKIDFTNGHGYIEKDWGHSFPDAWIWLQCNTFKDFKNSLFMSIANIPFLGFKFKGFICFIYHNGTFYNFSTYNHSKIKSMSYENEILHITLTNSKYTVVIKASQINGGELIAPSGGVMNRVIKESVYSDVQYELLNNKNILILIVILAIVFVLINAIFLL